MHTHRDVLPQHGPKATGLFSHKLELLKLGVKITLCYKTITSGILLEWQKAESHMLTQILQDTVNAGSDKNVSLQVV